MGFLFEVSVSMQGVTSNTTKVYLQYNRGVLSIQITCVTNCGVKVAVSSRLVLLVDCPECSDSDKAEASYSWGLFLLSNTTGRFETVPHVETLFSGADQANGRGAVIKERSLVPCQRYRVEVNMTLLSVGSGFAVLEFMTNCPPWGGNCTVSPLSGDVMTQTFKMECEGWKDEGFSVEANATLNNTELLASALVYKFLVRKNATLFPIAEGGASKMPRGLLPVVPGDSGSDYELVARIYDPLNDYTEVAQPVTLYVDDTKSSLQETLTFWDGQANYSDSSSTLTKQIRGLTIASSLISTYNVSDNQSKLQEATQIMSGDDTYVVDVRWDDLYKELQNPPASPAKDNLTEVTDKFTRLVYKRGEEVKNLTGQGLTALAEGLSTILHKPATTSFEAVKSAIALTDMATEALRTLYTNKPYPVAENLKETVAAMASLVDRLVAASIPSYDVMRGTRLVFNASDVSEDDKTFIVDRLKVAADKQDHLKIEQTRKVVPQLEKTLDAMFDTLLVAMVTGQQAEHVDREGLALTACKMTGATLTSDNVIISADPGTVDLNVQGISREEGSESSQNAELDIKATVFTNNPYAWSSDASSYDVTSPVVKLDIRDGNATVKASKLTVTVKRGTKIPIPAMETFSSNNTRDGPDNLLYHRLSLASAHSALVTYIKVPVDMGGVVAYFRSGKAPTLDRYDVKTEGEQIHSIGRRDVDNYLSQNKDMATFKFVISAGALEEGLITVAFRAVGDNNGTFVYEYLSFTDSCRVWDEKNYIWTPACQVSTSSSPAETVCICNNPPGMTFASAFLVAPNTIDFSLVFSKFDAKNASVYGTLIAILAVWILGVLWTRRQDKRDKERWLVGFLKDNIVGDSYFYLLTVHTGLKRGSGTKSNVSFVLTGSQSDSGVRMLTDGKRTLDTGSVMRYIMTTGTCMGNLEYVRVWHDSSGGYKAGWYLSRIDVEDLQTGQRYMFICERWLAWDREDGLVDRFIPLAQQDEVMSFDKLFSEYTKIGLTDTHLWLSCLLRPEPSAFTRVQRASCCILLLLLTMITSAMFYKREHSETGDSTNSVGLEVKVGFLRFSITTLWTSSVSILITSLPTMLLVVLFRYSRPKPGPRVLPRTGHKYANTGVTDTKSPELKAETRSSNFRRPEHLEINLEEKPQAKTGKWDRRTTNISREKMSHNKRPDETGHLDRRATELPENRLQENPLPYWCRYVAWLILLVSGAACAFFLVLYSMQWGSTTSEEWLASFVISFFESIFVLDPIKVIILACLLAFCAQDPYSATTHRDLVDLNSVHQEAKELGTEEPDLPGLPPDPVPQKVLAEARKRREQEQVSQRVFTELILYTFFVFCVFSLSYNNRDVNTNHLNKHLSNLFFAKDAKDAPFGFENISSRDDVMTWLNDTMLPTLFPKTDAMGRSLQLRERVFTSDPTVFRIGPVRVRQLRMPFSERKSGRFQSLVSRRSYCPPYSMEEEERRSFCVGWRESSACSYDDLETKLSRAAWRYQTLTEESSLPVWGVNSLYSSGGYIMDFSVNWDVVTSTLTELQEGGWVDPHTRAVFVEFSLYNPDSNLFSYLRFAAEFIETGDTLVWKDLYTLRIYQHLQATGLYNYICEIIVLIAILILTAITIVKMIKQKLGYFRDFWQMLDLCIVLTSYVTVTFYALKTLAVNNCMAAWRGNPKVYVDFYHTAFWDVLYGYLLAAVVFITTLRLLRILGYNRRLTMIGAVLADSGRDLLGFSLVFCVVFAAYVAAGYLLFASTQRDFRTPWQCVLALYQILLGRNVLSIISEDGVLFAWVYFISFIVLVFLILLTMFQAILCDASRVVRADVTSVAPPYGLTNLMVKFYRTLIEDWMPAWLTHGKVRAANSQMHTARVSPHAAGGPEPRYDKRHPSYYMQNQLQQPIQSKKQKGRQLAVHSGSAKPTARPKERFFRVTD